MEQYMELSDDHRIIQMVLSKFSFALLFMTIGMVLGALFIPLAFAAMMPFVCLIALFVAFWVRGRQANAEGKHVTFSMTFVYGFAAMMGVGLYPSVMYYAQTIGANLVMTALAVTFLLFFGLAYYASHTQRNFLGMGSMLMGALFALIVVSIVGLFIHATALQITITCGGLFIFSGFVLYDIQVMRSGFMTEEDVPLMVLNLFLDFLNLFLYVLRFMGILSSND